MTAYWGPGFDAEIAYRHEQVRAQFQRNHRFGRRRRTIANDVPPAGELAARPRPVIPMQRAAATADRPAPTSDNRRAA